MSEKESPEKHGVKMTRNIISIRIGVFGLVIQRVTDEGGADVLRRFLFDEKEATR